MWGTFPCRHLQFLRGPLSRHSGLDGLGFLFLDCLPAACRTPHICQPCPLTRRVQIMLYAFARYVHVLSQPDGGVRPLNWVTQHAFGARLTVRAWHTLGKHSPDMSAPHRDMRHTSSPRRATNTLGNPISPYSCLLQLQGDLLSQGNRCTSPLPATLQPHWSRHTPSDLLWHMPCVLVPATCFSCVVLQAEVLPQRFSPSNHVRRVVRELTLAVLLLPPRPPELLQGAWHALH